MVGYWTSSVHHTYNYTQQGPNFCWQLDGYDKLSSFGFYIHGYIDGFVNRCSYNCSLSCLLLGSTIGSLKNDLVAGGFNKPWSKGRVIQFYLESVYRKMQWLSCAQYCSGTALHTSFANTYGVQLYFVWIKGLRMVSLAKHILLHLTNYLSGGNSIRYR